jgi:hypothetical protein
MFLFIYFVILMDQVQHNDALGSEASETSQKAVSRDKHRGDYFLAYY